MNSSVQAERVVAHVTWLMILPYDIGVKVCISVDNFLESDVSLYCYLYTELRNECL